MRTEREKMLAGDLYLASDPELTAARVKCRRLLRQLNESDPADEAGGREILARILGRVGNAAWIEPPFFCDYGTNIEVGSRLYVNFNCVIL